jgi:hypothetical protein
MGLVLTPQAGALCPPEARLSGPDSEHTSYGSSSPSTTPTAMRDWSRSHDVAPRPMLIRHSRFMAAETPRTFLPKRGGFAHPEANQPAWPMRRLVPRLPDIPRSRRRGSAAVWSDRRLQVSRCGGSITAIIKEITDVHMGPSEVAHLRPLQRKPLSGFVSVDTLCLINRWEK